MKDHTTTQLHKRACIRRIWIYSFNPGMVELAPGNCPDLEIESYITNKRKYSSISILPLIFFAISHWSQCFISETNLLKKLSNSLSFLPTPSLTSRNLASFLPPPDISFMKVSSFLYLTETFQWFDLLQHWTALNIISSLSKPSLALASVAHLSGPPLCHFPYLRIRSLAFSTSLYTHSLGNSILFCRPTYYLYMLISHLYLYLKPRYVSNT